MKAVSFTNWTDQDFTHTWDRIPYTFPAGKEVMIQDYLANHFAKHLVDRELNKMRLPTNHHTRQELITKCFGGEHLESISSTELEAQILNTKQNIEEELKPRRGRPAKKKEETSPSEVEFEDLQS